ncbi:hypothetical protein PI124_g8153 [Phytophthora idaei]|nr:hypothetical protein PI125_g8246 [Phytophthora idaei]KAG3159660.1 hypothetical protein PI126_g7286 [Phytophthora idaei]KAG3247127.1 hypothetical protein PI124_g8153 [Phytophthora idaei]
MKSPQSASLLVACDDAATLEAALDLVDHCDDPLTDPMDPDQTQDLDVTLDNLSEFLDQVDTPSLHSAVHQSSRPHNAVAMSEPSTRHRTTAKQEIAQLRAEEKDLACILELLRLQAYSQRLRDTTAKNGKVLPFWKKIASRQYQIRLDLEGENRRLRSFVTMHIGRAKRLKLAWTKRLAAERDDKENEMASRNSDELFLPDTPAVMEQLTSGADAVYAGLDAFLGGVRQQQRSRIPFLEHSDNYSLPFERQTVDRAIWHALASRFRGHQQRANVTDDTITCCALRRIRIASMNLRLRIRWVARKYCEADRTVFITRTLVEPLHLTISAQVGFWETQVSIVTLTDTGAGVASARVDTRFSVTGDGPDGGTGDGMRAWIASPDARGARSMWMHAFEMRKTAIEDQLFEDSRTL